MAIADSLAGGAPVTEFVALERGETVVGLAAADAAGAGLALGTAAGVVKRVALDYPGNAADFEVITLKEGDEVVGAVQLASEDCDLVFITSDAQLLRFGAPEPSDWMRSSQPPTKPRVAASRTARVALSVGRTGQCWDNALSESFFASLKGELIDTRPWPTKAAARRAIVEYIAWYNGTRLHSTLGYRSPAEFEADKKIKKVA